MAEIKPKMAIANGNGTYRIPITGMNIRIEGNPPCLFGDIADLIGQVEALGDIEDLKEMKRRISE